MIINHLNRIRKYYYIYTEHNNPLLRMNASQQTLKPLTHFHTQMAMVFCLGKQQQQN